MLKPRVIPCLLLSGRGLYKTVKFNNPKYVGDPVNAVKIFNEKEVDELLLLDITATTENREPNYELIGDIASECFMPLAYGGGIKSIEQIRKLHRVGIEKVCLNTAAYLDPKFVKESCEIFGSSSIVAAMDVKKNFFGRYEVYVSSGKSNTKQDPVAYAKHLERLGVGEIFVNSVDRDGMMSGYDLVLLKSIALSVDTPVIGCGGAGSLEHVKVAIAEAGVNAVAAGSMFVFHGKHKAVLINYPSPIELAGLELDNKEL